MKRKVFAILALVLCAALLLSGCGLTDVFKLFKSKKKAAAPTPTATVAVVENKAAVETVAPAPTPTTVVEATPAPTPTPTPTPAPTPTPTPTPAPTPTPTPPPPAPGSPVVTKSPTDETVNEGDKAYFLAGYLGDNTLAVWHFVSPDGQTDITYDQAGAQFPPLVVSYGDQIQVKLDKIPAALDGWKVYCRLSNAKGGVNTDMATIHVNGASNAATGAAGNVPVGEPPVVTKSPTNENVVEGGECWFVAKNTGAVMAVWHFVSPDKSTDIAYDEAQAQFPTLQILNGMQGAMQLKNIPVELNGWSFYCRYSNNAGSVDTDSATITVRAAATQAPAAGTTA